jgi:hypothetical protein
MMGFAMVLLSVLMGSIFAIEQAPKTFNSLMLNIMLIFALGYYTQGL